MRHDKLVRDKIPEIIQSNGDSSSVHIADDDEYWDKLKQKLIEEATEFIEDESIEELADVMEVLEAIQSYKKFDKLAVEFIRVEKRTKRGGFEKRIILEETH